MDEKGKRLGWAEAAMGVVVVVVVCVDKCCCCFVAK